MTPGINVLKTFDPPLQSIAGQAITGVGRRGKQFTIGVEGGLVEPAAVCPLGTAGDQHTVGLEV